MIVEVKSIAVDIHIGVNFWNDVRQEFRTNVGAENPDLVLVDRIVGNSSYLISSSSHVFHES